MNKTIPLALGALAAAAATAPQAQIKAGFGYDQDLGITAQLDRNINFFIGNDGIAGDYLLSRGDAGEVEGRPLTWYIGGGLWVDWDDGFGVRMPLGLELALAPRWQAYTQIAPDLDLDKGGHFGLQFAVAVRYLF